MPESENTNNCRDCKVLAERIVQLEKRMMDKFGEADLRYQQRFDAAGAAVTAAFSAQQVAMQTALTAAEKAVSAALAAADRAVSKAEMASEKRFEAVNEFRAALSDQATKLVTRLEVEQSIGNVLDKLEGVNGIARRLEDITRRLDTFIARGSGAEEESRDKKLATQWVVGLVVFGVLAVLGLSLTFAGLLRGH